MQNQMRQQEYWRQVREEAEWRLWKEERDFEADVKAEMDKIRKENGKYSVIQGLGAGSELKITAGRG